MGLIKCYRLCGKFYSYLAIIPSTSPLQLLVSRRRLVSFILAESLLYRYTYVVGSKSYEPHVPMISVTVKKPGNAGKVVHESTKKGESNKRELFV